MAALALALIDAVGNIGVIIASQSFAAAEAAKIKVLRGEADALTRATQAASELYNNTYYPVAVNLQRVKAAVDTVPNELLAVPTVSQDVNTVSNDAKAIARLADIMGASRTLVSGLSGFSDVIQAIRNLRVQRPGPTTASDGSNPWRGQPGSEGTPTVGRTIPRTTISNRILKGLDVAVAVFSIGALAATIGFGAWTLQQIEATIREVRTKKREIDNFAQSMRGQW